MKKFIIITLLLIGFTLSVVSSPINSASSINDVPEPHAAPFVHTDVI